MFQFPLFLNVEKKPVLVVGGGAVAARKTAKLLDAKAEVTVVSPELGEALYHMYKEGKVNWQKEKCTPKHLQDMFLIISASGNPQAQEIIRKHTSLHQLINGADCPDIGNVAFPATFESQGVHVAISTAGHHPSLSKQYKTEIKEWLDSKDNRNT